MTLTLIVVVGFCFGLGIVGVAMALRSDRQGSEAEPLLHRVLARSRRDLPLWLLAAGLGALAGLLTGWPVAVPLIGLAVYGLPKLFGRTSASVSIVRVEAIAAWTEMLQATLAASAGLSQAMVATAPLTPLAIRGATMRLSGRLTAGMHPGDALLLLADELEDPSADRVICALRLAVSARALRLGDLLMALSDSTRDEVALRLRIETSRAAVRSGVRTVLVFSVAFAIGLTLLAHTYLEPFGSPTGQLVLLVVGLCYGFGLTLMVAMARPPRPIRLLGRQVIEA
jgi:tight adherence protein B